MRKSLFVQERLGNGTGTGSAVAFEDQWCDTKQGMLESELEFELEACRTAVPTSSTCTYQL